MSQFESIVSEIWDGQWCPSNDKEVDQDTDTLLLEHSDLVYSRFQERFYVLDRFPLIIDDNAVFQQLKINYETVSDNKELEVYIKEEEKFKKILSLLWAYSSVWIETSLPYEKIENIISKISNEATKARVIEMYSELHNTQTNSFKVLSLNDLLIIAELSLREYISSVFVFKTLKICLWSSFDLSMCNYIGNQQSTELMRTICATEGLYLR